MLLLLLLSSPPISSLSSAESSLSPAGGVEGQGDAPAGGLPGVA